jgi:hypothetical protein
MGQATTANVVIVPANAASRESIRRIEFVLRANSYNSDYRLYVGRPNKTLPSCFIDLLLFLWYILLFYFRKTADSFRIDSLHVKFVGYHFGKSTPANF